MPDDGIPGKFGYLVAMACQESSDEPFDSGNTIPLPDFPVLEPNSAFTTEPLTNARSFSPVLGDMEQGDDMNELSDESLFDLLYSNEMFTNGLGFSMEAVTGTFPQHVETAKRRSAFIEERVGGPSPSYTCLPYLWHSKGKTAKTTHYYASICMSTTIVAKELGFGTAIDYVQCRGWTLHNKGGKPSLKYRNLTESFYRNGAPGGGAMNSHFSAMVEHLYKIIEQNIVRDVYTNKPALRFLTQDSFKSKLHLHAQEFQLSLIIVKAFFIDHVPSNKGDVFFWMKKIFISCRRHKDFTLFVQNTFALFSEGPNPALAKELLTTYLDCIRDQVNHRVSAAEYQRKYNDLLEKSLSSVRRVSMKNLSPARHLLMARLRSRDFAIGVLKEDGKATLPSSTRKKRKKKSGDQLAAPAGECCASCLCCFCCSMHFCWSHCANALSCPYSPSCLLD